MFFAHRPTRAWLSDKNYQLINAFKVVRDSPIELAERLSVMSIDADFYLGIAKQEPRDSVGKAARFVYLNKTAFGGIWRENRSGQFNVPFNKYSHSSLPRKATLLAVSNALQSVSLDYCSFDKALAAVPDGALIYCDPPYGRSVPERGFNRYIQEPYRDDDHSLLASLLDGLSHTCSVLVSLPADPVILRMYDLKRYMVYETTRITGLGFKSRSRAARAEVLLASKDLELNAVMDATGWRSHADT